MNIDNSRYRPWCVLARVNGHPYPCPKRLHTRGDAENLARFLRQRVIGLTATVYWDGVIDHAE